MRRILSLVVTLLLAGNCPALVLYNNAVPPSIPPSGVMGLYAGWMGSVVINPNWILVCNHEGGGVGTTVVVNGTTYVVAAMYYSGSYDLNLARITNVNGSNANLPVYADMSLNNSSLTGKQVVIGGFGYTRGALTAGGGGYNWTSVGSGVLQWGTNIVTYNEYNYLYDSFQPYGSSKGTPYEAALAEGDSGGGWFFLNASTGRWTVAALNDGVTTNGASMFNPPDTNDAVGVPGVAAWANAIISAWEASADTVTVDQTPGGTVSVSPSLATYPSGATATVMATPASGYLFSGWIVSGGTVSGNTGTDTLTVDGNVTLSANFTAETYTITVNQKPGGVVSVYPSNATYPSGATATVTATPAAGYLFSGWIVTGGTVIGNTGTDTLTVEGNVTLSASFTAEKYTVTVNQNLGGAVSVSPSNATYLVGATATVTATPAAGYLFSGWIVTGGTVSGNTGTDTLTVEGNVTLSASFTAETFTVTAAPSTTWVYQNTPMVTMDRHAVALTITVADPWGNNNYTVTVTQAGPGLVTPTQYWTSGTTVTPTPSAAWTVPAGSSLSGYLVGGRVCGSVTGSANQGVLTGQCTVTVTVLGDVSGPQNPATATATVLVRPLGDINGAGSVSSTDKMLLMAMLNGSTSPDVTNLDPEVWDLDGSGSVSITQKNILNAILDGFAIQ